MHACTYVCYVGGAVCARPLVVPFAFEKFCLSADRRATNSLSFKSTIGRQPGHSIVTSRDFNGDLPLAKKNLPPVTHSKDFSACFDRVINVASLSLAFGSELPTGGDILPAREGGGRGHHPSHLLKITLAATMTLHSFFPLFLLSAFLLISSSRTYGPRPRKRCENPPCG